MDFVTGALPNVMFIAGLIAMGIGLGIEFKIVEIKGELSKQGRIGAIGIGADPRRSSGSGGGSGWPLASASVTNHSSQ